MRSGPAGRAIAVACALIVAAASSAAADGARDIASVTATTYFDGTWRLETSNVVLVRIIPALTLEERFLRVDSAGWNQLVFFIGPVVNFSDTLYAGAVYGLGIDSLGAYSHELTAGLSYETDTTATSLGVKADWFPATGYAYFLPSISGKFHPLPALGLFGKFFLSVDTAGVVTESFWGEADYRFTPVIAARAGFTVSRANAFGYSGIAGIDLTFSESFALRYSIQYLSDTVEYLTEPQPRSGIANTLIVDVKP